MHLKKLWKSILHPIRNKQQGMLNYIVLYSLLYWHLS